MVSGMSDATLFWQKLEVPGKFNPFKYMCFSLFDCAFCVLVWGNYVVCKFFATHGQRLG